MEKWVRRSGLLVLRLFPRLGQYALGGREAIFSKP